VQDDISTADIENCHKIFGNWKFESAVSDPFQDSNHELAWNDVEWPAAQRNLLIIWPTFKFRESILEPILFFLPIPS